MTHWTALTAALTRDSVTFSWPELDHLVGGLPASATNHRAWWSGDRPHVRLWRAAGYTVDRIELGRTVTFIRTSDPVTIPERPLSPGSSDVVLVACAKTKGNVPAPARDLYVSPAFRKSRSYAEGSGRPWFILSAEYGLLAPDQLVAPYDRYLPDMTAGYRAAWGRWTVERLALLFGPLPGRVVEAHAGAAYIDAIAPHLAHQGAELVDQLKGLGQGERQAWYGSLTRIVDQLLAVQTARSPAQFLASGGTDLQGPGLYSWWVDGPGADELSRGLKEAVQPGLIYAGLAGATRWPSGARSTNTLWKRIATMHLGGNHEFSTFRYTLGAILAEAAGLDGIDEAALTAWMHERLTIVAVPYADADSLGRLEELVLRQIDPPFNLKGMPATTVRARITQLRRTHGGPSR